MPASGGEVKELWSFGEIEWGTPGIDQAWSPDGQYILFAAPDLNDMRNCDLWRISVDGGNPEKVGLQRSWGIISPTFSPDGRKLAFAGRGGASTDSELWVLENFLPESK